MRRTEPALKIPILQINRQPGELVLVATASTALMHASVISEVVMQIRMEKFPGIKLESPQSASGVSTRLPLLQLIIITTRRIQFVSTIRCRNKLTDS